MDRVNESLISKSGSHDQVGSISCLYLATFKSQAAIVFKNNS